MAPRTGTHGFPSPLAGGGRDGGAGANAPNAGADTPLSNSPPQGGRGPVGAAAEKRVLLGEFGRAHGLKGEVRLKSFTDDPRAIAKYSPLESEDGRRFALKSLRPAGGG